MATWKWKTHKGNHGYILQHCTNTADATTFSAPAYSSKGTFELTGQTPGRRCMRGWRWW